jgi:hypothetical protein
MVRNCLLNRLRVTADPILRRTIKIVACCSRPCRTQRLAPLIQLIKSVYRAKRLRPLRRRRFNIARPAAVLIRLRKPCLLRRFLLLGWKVRFTVKSLLIVYYLHISGNLQN